MIPERSFRLAHRNPRVHELGWIDEIFCEIKDDKYSWCIYNWDKP